MKKQLETFDKKYIVQRGIENEKGRFEAGKEVSEAELLKVFPEDTVRLWALRGILVEVMA